MPQLSEIPGLRPLVLQTLAARQRVRVAVASLQVHQAVECRAGGPPSSEKTVGVGVVGGLVVIHLVLLPLLLLL